jgi:hypothetical protein
MEHNLGSLMKTLQELCGSNFYKEIGKGILGMLGNEVMRRIFNACSGNVRVFLVMKEKLNC